MKEGQITPSLTPTSTQAGCNTFRNISVLILLHNGQSQVLPHRGFRKPKLQPRKKAGYSFSCVQPGLAICKHRLPHYSLNTTRDLKESRCFDFQFKTMARQGHILRWKVAEDHGSSGLGEWLYVRGGHCSVGSDAAWIKSNQIKPNESFSLPVYFKSYAGL